MPLSILKQSARNLRTIGADDIADLVASVASRGVVIPLLVRPLDGGQCFEVVDGHRRLAAALAVANGKDEEARGRVGVLPVAVADLTDDEAAELQIVANVQRASLHYLDESAAFVELVRRGYDPPGIAAKVGKSLKYVERRLALRGLSEAFKKLAVKGALVLPERSAEFLASLPLKAQAHIYERCVRKFGKDDDAAGRVEVETLGDLRRVAQKHTIIDLARAPFSQDDPDLVSRAGSCAKCPKRVGTSPLLFDGYKETTCTDAACYFEKVNAHVAATEKAYSEAKIPLLKVTKEYGGRSRQGVLEHNQFVDAKQGSCEHSKNAVLVGVEYDSKQSVGELISVCAEPTCKVHRGTESPYRRSPQELAKERKRTRAKTLAVSTGQAQLNALAGEIIVRKHGPARINSDELGRIVRAYLDKLGFDALKAIARSLGADKAQLKEPRKFVFGCLENSKTISEDLGLLYRTVYVDVLMGLDGGYYGTDDRKALRATLAHYKIDPDEIAGDVRREFKAKWAKADARGKVKKKPTTSGAKEGAAVVHGSHTGCCCRYCGCTESTPCGTEAGACSWLVKPKKQRGNKIYQAGVCTAAPCTKAFYKDGGKKKQTGAVAGSEPMKPQWANKPKGERKSRKPGKRGKKWIN
jgi:ParB family chromosome partitioning protein